MQENTHLMSSIKARLYAIYERDGCEILVSSFHTGKSALRSEAKLRGGCNAVTMGRSPPRFSSLKILFLEHHVMTRQKVIIEIKE